MKTFGLSDIGCVRKKNEDRHIIKKMPGGSVLIAVADGLGGEVAGDRAAEIAIETLTGLRPGSNDIEKSLDYLVKEADLTILKEVEKDTSLAGMSTTVTGTLIDNGNAYWVHVGDSRLYKLRDQKFIQITKDHNLAQFLIEEGEITKEQARKHPTRHYLYQCVGCGGCCPDTGHMTVKNGDLLVHTTDGLNEVPADTMTSILNSTDDIEAKVNSLIQAAPDEGGKDNITVVIAEI
ncbi:MAG: serine/threonine-protein phosphatase [Deltaproteobacteria bacterium]|nr:MAG: serine/threonine-protein phosphatase [Deltaproteobacteria bacterium]